jgi:hypothetical protein
MEHANTLWAGGPENSKRIVCGGAGPRRDPALRGRVVFRGAAQRVHRARPCAEPVLERERERGPEGSTLVSRATLRRALHTITEYKALGQRQGPRARD